MGNFVNKMLNIVGFGAEDEYEDEYEDERNDDIELSSPIDRMNERRSSRVVKLHNNPSQMRVVVIQPESFEEARDITNH